MSEDPEKTQDLSQQPAVGGGSAALRAEQIPVGNRVGAYVIRSRIDAGGGGTVYVAESLDQPGKRVAIKVLLRELAAIPMALTRFQREAEVVRLVNHPAIAGVLDSDELPDGRPYIVMELVSTENLRSLLEQRGRLTPPELLEILEPVCSALAAAHAAGVVHRDLKASNISVGRPDGQLVVKLLDFGIAKMVQPDGSAGLTVMGTRLGTPHAMAPEQIRGEPVDARADIYALGVLLHHALTGKYPFGAATPQELERLHLTAPPPRPSRSAPVPAALDEVVVRCLEKKPEARYQSVPEFLAALQAAVAGGPAPAEEAGEEAVALHVELPAGDESDEEEQAERMDEAEQALRAAGYQLPVLTGNSIVAVRAVAGDPALARRQAVELGRDLAGRLGLKVAAQAGRGTALLRVADWDLPAERDGVRLGRDFSV